MAKTCKIAFSCLTCRYYLSYGGLRSKTEWKTHKGALKAAAARGFTVESEVNPKIEFEANEKKTKIVTNLMTGKLCRIPVNTPWCCNPASETYWSM